jgi:apolipoprotein D and lipocalin family protein
MKAGILLSAMLITLLLAGCVSRPPLPTVPRVDLKRYEGQWFEIAKYPNWFQRGCVADTSAEYAAQPDGSIRIVNRCRQKNGSIREVRGQASVVPGSNNAKLRVRFAGSPIAGDYWIIGLDEKNYAWALVGHPSRQFLWTLSRTPRLNPQTYFDIVSLAEKLGYKPERIEKTIQTPSR